MILFLIFSMKINIQSENISLTNLNSMKKRKGPSGIEETASTSIKMKLNTIMSKDTFLAPFRSNFLVAIDHTVRNMSRIQYLGSEFANFHLLRLIEHDLPLPELNQCFFGRCCAVITDTQRVNLDPEIINSFAQFSLLRPSFERPQNAHMGTFISSMARQMLTNFENQLMMEVPKRLVRYVRFKYKIETKYQAEGFIKSCFVGYLTLNQDQMEFKDWLKVYPFAENDQISQIPFHTEHFLKLSHKMLMYFESLEEGTKGRQLFTLAPLKADYMAVNITINSTTMIDLMAQLTPDVRHDLLCSIEIKDIEVNEVLVKALLSKNKTIIPELLSNVEFSNACFQVIFDVKKFERERVKFDYSIKTNGMSLNGIKECQERRFRTQTRTFFRPSDCHRSRSREHHHFM